MFKFLIQVGEGPLAWDLFYELLYNLFGRDFNPKSSIQHSIDGIYALVKDVPRGRTWEEVKEDFETFGFVVWYVSRKTRYGEHEFYSKVGRRRNGRNLHHHLTEFRL